MLCTITTIISCFPRVHYLMSSFAYWRFYLQISCTVIFGCKRLSFGQSGSFFYAYIIRQKSYKSRGFVIFYGYILLVLHGCVALIFKSISAFERIAMFAFFIRLFFCKIWSNSTTTALCLYFGRIWHFISTSYCSVLRWHTTSYQCKRRRSVFILFNHKATIFIRTSTRKGKSQAVYHFYFDDTFSSSLAKMPISSAYVDVGEYHITYSVVIGYLFQYVFISFPRVIRK